MANDVDRREKSQQGSLDEPMEPLLQLNLGRPCMVHNVEKTLGPGLRATYPVSDYMYMPSTFEHLLRLLERAENEKRARANARRAHAADSAPGLNPEPSARGAPATKE